MTNYVVGASLLILQLAALADTAVPLRRVGPYVLVEDVYINGHGPLRFLVDTGGESCMLSDRVARQIGIKPSYRVEVARAARPENIVLVDAVTVTTVRVGRFERHDVEVLIGSAMAEVHRFSRDIDGVLGQSFLGGFDSYTIDNRRRTLLLDAGPPAQGKPVTFEFENQRPRLEMRIAGVRRRLTLDSGAPQLLLLGQDRGLLPTNAYQLVYVNNRERIVILHQK